MGILTGIVAVLVAGAVAMTLIWPTTMFWVGMICLGGGIAGIIWVCWYMRDMSGTGAIGVGFMLLLPFAAPALFGFGAFVTALVRMLVIHLKWVG